MSTDMNDDLIIDDEQFNPMDSRLAVDPFPLLRKQREAAPIHESQVFPAWIVTGHELAETVLKRTDGDLRWEMFQKIRHGDEVVDEPYFTLMADSVLMKAGEDHRRVRRTFQKNFRPDLVEALRGRITDRAHQLIDAFADAGRAELARDFASPLTLAAIGCLLDVPSEDEEAIYEWMHGFKLAIQMLPLEPDQLRVANDSMTGLDLYFKHLVARRRANPTDDLMGKMIGDADAGVLTEEELIANLWSIYVGGHDTSALSICSALVTLMENPEELKALQADMSLLPNATEELLRFIATVHGTHRLMQEDIELDGNIIPADTPVMVYLSGANHDESWCPHADKLDITRDVPSDHLTFGTGPHKCPGQHMARLVIGTALGALLSRLDGLKIEDVEWGRDALLFRGPERLVVTWDRTLPREVDA
jgi:cytochrome P450